MTFVGTLGLFMALIFLFIRFLPMISLAEMRGLSHETKAKEKACCHTPQGCTALSPISRLSRPCSRRLTR